MLEVYSKAKPNLLLHLVQRAADISEPRTEVISPGEVLQLATLRLPQGKTFRPHAHIPCPRETDATQESWVVIKGRVKTVFYDIDDTIVHIDELGPGDCSVTLRGGHNYECLEESVVYEFKTGPYFGQLKDKRFID